MITARLWLRLGRAVILKTWWDSRIVFVSGVAYLFVLNAAYLFLRQSRRERTLAP